MNPLTVLVTALALVVYQVLSLNVGRARIQYGVKPPATTGNPDFERYLRVQQNTLEQLIVFLPSLWLFSLLLSPVWGAGLGLVWILGRILFAWGYYQAAEKRGPGFGVSFLASAALLLGALIGSVQALVSATV
jgi:glutathione S-transferase